MSSADVLEWLKRQQGPVSTPQIVAGVNDGARNLRERVWAALTRLRKKGLVRGTVRPVANSKNQDLAFWEVATRESAEGSLASTEKPFVAP